MDTINALIVQASAGQSLAQVRAAFESVHAEARAAVGRRLLARAGAGKEAAVYAEAVLAVTRATAASRRALFKGPRLDPEDAAAL